MTRRRPEPRAAAPVSPRPYSRQPGWTSRCRVDGEDGSSRDAVSAPRTTHRIEISAPTGEADSPPSSDVASARTYG